LNGVGWVAGSLGGIGRFMAGAVFAAIQLLVMFHAMPDDGASAVGADRGQGLDGTFKAVEAIGTSIEDDLHASVVVIAAGFALSFHGMGFPCWWLGAL
jgi:hypothetical protein